VSEFQRRKREERIRESGRKKRDVLKWVMLVLEAVVD
jgi:hypothetical protein